MTLRLILLFTCFCCAWMQTSAHAELRRFAVIAGNTRGLTDDEPLHYAVADAERVFEVLSELGDFAPENVALLRDATAAGLQQALTSVFERIRTQQPQQQSLLFFYYSGHADVKDLHLRDSTFSISELEQ